MIKKEIYIIIFLLLLLPLFSFNNTADIYYPNHPDNDFDSLNCKGYSYFKAKGIKFDSVSNIKLYNEVYSWLGVPYRYGGRSKAGADCSGFASQVYKNVYNIFISGSAGNLYNMLKPVERADIKEGDLVFFKINRSYISHVGVYLSNNKFIHETSYGKSVMISDLDEHYYKRYYFSAGRYEAMKTDSTVTKPVNLNSSTSQ
jgi:lipoprotein Spr